MKEWGMHRMSFFASVWFVLWVEPFPRDPCCAVHAGIPF